MKKQQINTAKAPAAIGPYSQAIVCGEFLFASGQIPIDPSTGAMIEGDITAQAHRVFANIKAVLEAANLDFKNIIKTTVFLKDINDFAALNDVYASYFEQPYPSRSCIEVARLPKDALVEIEIIASK